MDKLKRRAIYWGLLFVLLFVVSYFLDWFFGFESLDLFYRVIGVVVIIFSGVLLRVSGRTLRKFGLSEGKGFGDTDRLVTVGVYSCIRHPHHLGIALFALGFGLAIGSLSYLLVGVPVMWIAVYLFVKRIEEPEAIEKFGEAYIKYMRQVPAFIPWRGCRKNIEV